MDEDEATPSVPQRTSAFTILVTCALVIIVVWAVVSDLQLQFD